MSTVLATNTSSSNPSKTYNIIEGNDGVIYCECPGWKFKRDCKHLREYHHYHSYGPNLAPPVHSTPTPTPEPTDVDFLERLKGVYNE